MINVLCARYFLRKRIKKKKNEQTNTKTTKIKDKVQDKLFRRLIDFSFLFIQDELEKEKKKKI